MRRLAYILVVLGGFISCVEPIEIDTGKEITLLVVEGFITTEYGPHRIMIQKSAKYGDVFTGNPKQESGATVVIRDGAGNIVPLTEDPTADGFYDTPGTFRGVVGETYTLLIKTAGDITYQSIPQTIIASPEIDSVFFNYRKIPGENEFFSTTGVDVFVTYKDPGDENNFYLWDMEGTYLARTNPENYIIPGESKTPAPKDCCAVCYITDLHEKVDLTSDSRYNGRDVIKKIGFLSDNGLNFSDRYELDVKQYSISSASFRFYQVLNSQLSISGTIFDAPPAKLGSNILNITNPEELTIGYFGAYDVTTKKAFVDLSIIEEFQKKLIINDDCRLLKNSTTALPVGWPSE